MWKEDGVFGAPQAFSFGANPFVKTEFVSIKDAAGNLSQTAIKDYSYDQNGNVTEIKEYDWVSYSSTRQTDEWGTVSLGGIPAGAPLKRATVNTYHNPTADALSTDTGSPYCYWKNSAPPIKNAVAATEIKNVAGTPVSRSEFTYDNHETTGNVTQVRSWDSHKTGVGQPYSNPLTASNSIVVTTLYDPHGNPTLTKDAKETENTFTYGTIQTPDGAVTGLYPTKIETASNVAALKRTATMDYDFHTGLLKKSTDVDNNVSNEMVYDALGRLNISKAAVDTANEVWTQINYDDVARTIITKADLFDQEDGKKVSIQHFDQLGRLFLTRTLENPTTQSATNINHGIKVQTRYLTSSPYSYQLTSNPYRATTSAAALSEMSMGWTQSKSVNTGKHTEVETFSGAGLPVAFGGANASSTGAVKTDIDLDRVLVTDQAGKQRISRTNALGQLTDVWEITGADSATVSVSFAGQSSTGYQTGYQYDPLNNLTTVNQGSQTRSFSYSSLSRLTAATNPELGTASTSGTIAYAYDNNGNLTQKIDPRGVTTTFDYDALNRVKTRMYSGETGQQTPNVTYTYDEPTISHSKGRLTKVSSTVSQTEYTGFDVLGRVTSHKQTTDGVAYPTAYEYYLSGATMTETYPSTRVVKNDLNNINGDLSSIQSKKTSDVGFWSYTDTFIYTAAGAVSSMRLGNNNLESTVFNSRLQPTEIGLKKMSTGADLLKLNYVYVNSVQTGNNGNILQQTINVPAIDSNPPFAAVQDYTYDSLNRLKSATETIGSSQNWKQTFAYDRFGNRNFKASGTTIPDPSCAAAICNPTIDQTKNRFTTVQGYTYDLAGNLITDALGRTFNYDAENKQTAASNSGGSLGTYFYDGDGKRVKKIATVGGVQETTIFVYDASGRMVAEYSTNPATAANAKVSYLTTDHLGSPRITTDAYGGVISRRDFMPFGEEIVASGSRAGYGSDSIRQKFTAYERDNETNLDYAKARMHNYNLGRFTSPDPFNIVFEKQLEKDTDKGNRQFRNYISKPEQWNRYVYAVNNPLKFIDPDGREIRLSSSLTTEERNQILYHLQKLTRDKLNWKTDSKGNVNIEITKTKGGGKDEGTRLIRRLDGYKSVVTVTQGSGGNGTSYDNETNASNGTGSNSTVTFNPSGTPSIGTLDENTGISRSQDRPSWIGLAHELIHADHAARGTRLLGTGTYSYKDTNGRLQTATENRRELATVGIGGQNNKMDITENDIRREQGLRLRSEY